MKNTIVVILTLLASVPGRVLADTTDARVFGLRVGNVIHYSGPTGQVWESRVVKDSTDGEGNIYFWRTDSDTTTLGLPDFKVGVNHVVYDRGVGLTSAMFKLDADVGEGWLTDSSKGELSRYMVRQPDLDADPQWGAHPRRVLFSYKNRSSVETSGPVSVFIYVPQIGLVLQQDYVFGTTFFKLIGAKIDDVVYGVLMSAPSDPRIDRKPQISVVQVESGLNVQISNGDVSTYGTVASIDVFDVLGNSLATHCVDVNTEHMDTIIRFDKRVIPGSRVVMVVFYDHEHTPLFSTAVLLRSLHGDR
ncbi:MAG: hypothetical protein JSS89_11190 [Bacteroidetes bacterium]|nr:hypothetical protein [Bacteroidota bacterium]